MTNAFLKSIKMIQLVVVYSTKRLQKVYVYKDFSRDNDFLCK